jgi:hypothetical protein
MFIILFPYITTGKTEVSEEIFVQNENTHFMSGTSFFSRSLCSLKNYENHGLSRQAGREIKWRIRKLCCAFQLIETKI